MATVKEARIQASFVQSNRAGVTVAVSDGRSPGITLRGARPYLAQVDENMKLMLAAVMGCVLGPVLGLPQRLVLRRHIRCPGWWVPANSIAWAAGMPVILLAAISVTLETPLVRLAIGAAIAFTIVGAIHGVALAWFTSRKNSPDGGSS
jgi:hypothetical protein